MKQSELIIERHSKKEIIYNYIDNEIVSEYPPKRMNNATRKAIRDIKGMGLEEIKNYFKKGLSNEKSSTKNDRHHEGGKKCNEG
jgi:hypothetical protein